MVLSRGLANMGAKDAKACHIYLIFLSEKNAHNGFFANISSGFANTKNKSFLEMSENGKISKTVFCQIKVGLEELYK